MKQLGLTAVLVIALALGSVPAAGQDDGAEVPPLLAMLEFVPDSEATRAANWAAVRYVDFQALYVAEGVQELRTTSETQTLLDSVPLVGILTRIVAGPEAFQYVLQGVETMSSVVGFEWIASVDRSLEFGAPPSTGLILQGQFETAAIEHALSARGFAQTDLNGVPVWHRLEDGMIDLASREVTDPFGGNLGAAARIAVLPGTLANSRFWDITRSIIAARQDQQPSLADDPSYRALAEAVTAPEGLLVQALFLTAADVGYLDGDTSAYGALAPYTLAVLADRQEGQDQVHLIGLVYSDAASAEQAAEELANRIRAFAHPQQPDVILVERYGAQVTARVVESKATGQAVALVEVRYPLPAERVDPDTGLFIPGGLLYRAWVQALMQRAFSPLMITSE